MFKTNDSGNPKNSAACCGSTGGGRLLTLSVNWPVSSVPRLANKDDKDDKDDKDAAGKAFAEADYFD